MQAQDWRKWGFAFWVISVETGKRLGFPSVIIELFLVIKKKAKERKLSSSVLWVDKNLSRKSETLKDLKLCKWGKILGNEELSFCMVFWLKRGESILDVSEAADEEAADKETIDVESANVEADMSFSFNKTLAIWICQFLLGLT